MTDASIGRAVSGRLPGDNATALAPAVAHVAADVAVALREDLGDGDLTALLIPAENTSLAQVVAREQATLCGCAWFEQTFAQIDSAITVDWHCRDGERLTSYQLVCEVKGNSRAIVSGERTALNFLQTLSGTATTTQRVVAELAGTHTRPLDTRKTIPGLRRAQKYAVRCGGGYNHRMGLYDGVLIKENHIKAAGSIGAAIAALRRQTPQILIEVEVEDLDQIDAAISAGADMLLLDNFTPVELKAAVERAARRVKLEASGGFTLTDLGAIAASGVDFVSLGALTKHLAAIDFSMRFVA